MEKLMKMALVTLILEGIAQDFSTRKQTNSFFIHKFLKFSRFLKIMMK